MQDFLNQIFQFIQHSSINSLLLVGIVLFGGTWMGRIFQKLRIPQVVGYICLGLILGQIGFNIINPQALEKLRPFNTFALGLIGFMIGGELKIQTIKKFGKQFITILLMESLGAFFVVSILVTTITYFFFHDWQMAISLGLLLGAISSATAPAATTDVLWENKTKGPLTTILLGIVAMDDAVALLLFAIASTIVSIISGQGDVSLSSNIFQLLWETGAAVVLGMALAVLLKRVIKNFVDEDKILAFTIGSILLVIGLSKLLEVNTILATMSMGFFITNFLPQRSKETFELVERFTPPVYILFFVMVGATLQIQGLTFVSIVLAGIYIVGRIAGKSLGSVLGARLSKAPESVRKYLPFCLLSQAGVAIGLSIIAGIDFPGPIGSTIVLIVTATTFVVQLLGPTSVKYAVTKAGEVGLNITELDLIRQSKGKDLTDKNIPLLKENDNLNQILSIFANHDNLYFPVINSQMALVGILSIDKLKDTFMASDVAEFLLAHDIMEKVIYSASPETPATEIYEIFQKSNVASIPIVEENGMVLGIIEHRRMKQLISQKLSNLREKAKEMEEL